MFELNEEWKVTNNRFVCFMDILGFKDRIMRNSHDDIYKDLEEFNSIIFEASGFSVNDAEVYVVNFSDSIVFFSKGDSIDDFYTFVSAIALSFKRILARKIPIKAGLAHGITSINKENRIFFGQPIIDALEMQEDVNYLGIVCHHTFEKYYYNLINSALEGKEKLLFHKQILNLFINGITPLKSGKSVHLNLAWYKISLDEFKENTENKDIINELKITMSGPPRRYIDNTIEFVKSYSEN